MSTRIPKENFLRAWARISLMFLDGLAYALLSFVCSCLSVPLVPFFVTYREWARKDGSGFFSKLWRSLILMPVVCLGALASPFVNLWGNLRHFYPIALHEWKMRDVLSECPYMVAWMRKRIREDEDVRRRQAEAMAARAHPAEESNG